VSDSWNPQVDWRQLGGQPPYQGELYREPGDELSDHEPANGPRPPRRKNQHLVRNILGGIGILAVIGLVVSALSSSGGGSPAASSRTSASAGSTHSAAAGQATASPVTQPTGPGTIGSSFTVQDGSGDTYQVTAVKVIDPASAADHAIIPQRGSRFVGIVFRITALTGSPQGEDANNDTTVVGSDGQAYQAVFDGIAGYTNFEVGVIDVAQGATVVGAVTFELPQFVNVAQVKWTAGGGFGSTVSWSAGS
jgi:hypothetical protein